VNSIENSIFLYKVLPLAIKGIAVLMAILAGYLVYSGLATRMEKQQIIFRFKVAMLEEKKKFIEKASTSKNENIFKEAGYPLGINGVRWEIIKWSFLVFTIGNYIVFPLMVRGDYSLVSAVLIVVGFVLIMPTFPFSIIRFILNRLIEYKVAKRNSELFSLYDMLISEIQMMQNTRINSYSIIRTLKPYFKELDAPLTRLLTSWTSQDGPEKALDVFAQEININEAKSLANVLKKFDENKRETILQSLKGMEDSFVTSQIENYRRRRKLNVDLAKLPIKVAHWLIIFNFILVIVHMVSFYMKDARL
jgi:hypothetical protein